MADADEVCEGAPVGLSRCWCVTGGSLGTVPWVISKTEEAAGVTFIRLHKADSGFERFVLGGYRGSVKSLKDMTWLDWLRNERNRVQLEDTTPPTEAKPMFADMKKRKPPPVCKRDMPTVVTIELPELEDHPAISVRVLTASNIRSNVAVELRADVMQYVRKAIIGQGKRETPTKRERPEVEGERNMCRWMQMPRTKRGEAREPQAGFQAFRETQNGVKKTRFFPAESDASDAVDRCRDIALAWAKGETETQASDGGELAESDVVTPVTPTVPETPSDLTSGEASPPAGPVNCGGDISPSPKSMPTPCGVLGLLMGSRLGKA